MHLCDGGGTQRLVVKGRVKLVHRLTKVLLDLRMDSLHVHGRYLRTKLHERFTVFMRNIVGLLRSNLADFDKGRSQILKDARHDLGRNAVVIIVLFQDTEDLPEPSVGIRLSLLGFPALLDQSSYES